MGEHAAADPHDTRITIGDEAGRLTTTAEDASASWQNAGRATSGEATHRVAPEYLGNVMRDPLTGMNRQSLADGVDLIILNKFLPRPADNTVSARIDISDGKNFARRLKWSEKRSK